MVIIANDIIANDYNNGVSDKPPFAMNVFLVILLWFFRQCFRAGLAARLASRKFRRST